MAIRRQVTNASLSASLLLTLTIVTAASLAAEPLSRIELIREKGYLSCGVLPHVDGFAAVDQSGRYSGFEIDLCTAVAAAILGEAAEVRFVIVRTVDQFKSRDDIDIVSRRLTWTMRREVESGLIFSPVVFFDGAGFLVRSPSKIERVEQLSSKPICVKSGSEANRALVRYFDSGGLELVEVARPALSDASHVFFEQKCTALVADVSELAAERGRRIGDPDRFEILPARISKEPLAMLMRQRDTQFFLAVRWTILLLIAAEEAGLTSKNIDTGYKGIETFNYDADPLNLDPMWVRHVIKQVGNYGEIYSRNLGAESPIRLERGLNDLWTRGGLLYAPPLR